MAVALTVLLVAGCTAASDAAHLPGATPSEVSSGASPSGAPSSVVPPSVVPPSVVPPSDVPPSGAPAPPPTPTVPPLPDGVTVPASLGQPLPERPDGFGEILPTPEDLQVRRVPTTDLLPPPASDTFESQVVEVPDDVLARSTWSAECPVTVDELRYVTVSFWGFDERPHTGEMLVNAAWAEQIADVFRQLFDARFPIEEMRIVSSEELDADLPPTGDGNDTTSFVCRPARQSTSWSQHAYGLAVDVNPFHNPYRRGDLVLPEKASSYLDRGWHRPGMIMPGDVVTTAFAELGWGWGGQWSSLTDTMHFSANGR